ncbi:putative intracellular multiplication protein IcmG [Piscirickettsia salmonis]|uniref:hypothetical protein n=1 Tax=Piscirickettsia salmonis TaxID=1238 RepID=UPI0012B9C985|nr:hypothetical protein [Piscirickettsia salmonis]QGP50585.1 putative intracellular multiplication protein IcmG [Piscirickettsia salmonis]QGP54208.1 putative intracellular multiplication protein IcmG [Piscirickettsia salmonis]QGP59893.1 putative intracellular multiplication protein IcmG [Piscirickettsia salmonis]QGP63785.1 putative intracellular multiplication protein IcmG [Piscirickettsia salmonis]
MSNNHTDKNYNFDDDQDINEDKEDLAVDNEPAVKRNNADAVWQGTSLWDKIRPMLHYYIIAIIAFAVAGYMMYNAYRTLYPKQPVQQAEANHLSFSNQVETGNKPAKGFSPLAQSQENKVKNKSGLGKKEEIKPNASYSSQTGEVAGINGKKITDQIKKLAEKVDDLNRQVQKIVESQSQSYSYNEEAKKLAEKVSESQNDIENHVKSLASNIDLIDKKLSKLENVSLKNNKNINLMLANQYSHREKLRLRAIVSGRAWLVNDDGVTLTVTKNTDIPGYGHVIKVDDKQTQVTMSSGYIFN